MKLGKIYDYRNKEEAKKLIGEKVATSDYLYTIETVDSVHNPETLIKVRGCNEYPFGVRGSSGALYSYQFIREVIEEEPTLMTNRQLAKWASKRLGEIKNGKTVGVCVHYDEADGNYPPDPTVRIRYWDSEDWIIPTVDIYERDCKA